MMSEEIDMVSNEKHVTHYISIESDSLCVMYEHIEQ